MSEYVKVKGMEMVRDTKNNSLINQNKYELENYCWQSYPEIVKVTEKKVEIN